LHLSEMFVSRPVLDKLQHKENIEVVGDFIDMFDDAGELVIG
jgi:hypothetical protein